MQSSSSESSTNTAESSSEKPGFIQRFKTAMTKPMNIFVAGILFILTLGVEYGFSRVMDLVWEVDTSGQVEQLNDELQSSTLELNKASLDLQKLVASIEANGAESPEFKNSLAKLSERLSSFDSLLETTSTNTAKVAVFSNALQEDYIRMKEFSDGRVEGVPNLVLAKHESIRICGGLVAIAVNDMWDTRIKLTQNGWATSWKSPGSRIELKAPKGGYMDFLGLQGEHAKFKLICDPKA